MSTNTTCFYDELNEPLTINNSVYSYFTSNTQLNLIVQTGTNVIEIYDIQSTHDDDNVLPSQSQVLQRHDTYHLHGDIHSIESIRIPLYQQGERELLAIACSESKICIIGYNDREQQCITLYTNEWDLYRSTLANVYNIIHIPQLCIDRYDDTSRSSGSSDSSMSVEKQYTRCIVMSLYNTHIVLIPIHSTSAASSIHNDQHQHRDDGMNAINQSHENDSKHESHINITNPYASHYGIGIPYIIDLYEDCNIRHFKSFTLLQGFTTPTLCILYERVLTTVGRYAIEKNNNALYCLSCNPYTQSSIFLSHVTEGLSHEIHTLIPCDIQVGGGCLLIATNLIYYFNSHHIDYILSVNEYGDTNDMIYRNKDQTSDHMILELDNTRLAHSFMTPYHTMMVDKHGRIYVLSLMTIGTSIKHIDIQCVGQASAATSISTIPLYRKQYNRNTNDIDAPNNSPSSNVIDHHHDVAEQHGYVFIGSRLAHSLHISYTYKPNNNEPQVKILHPHSMFVHSNEGVLRSVNVNVNVNDDELDELLINDSMRHMREMKENDVNEVTNGKSEKHKQGQEVESEMSDDMKDANENQSDEPDNDESFFTLGTYAEPPTVTEHPLFHFAVVDQLISTGPTTDFTITTHTYKYGNDVGENGTNVANDHDVHRKEDEEKDNNMNSDTIDDEMKDVIENEATAVDLPTSTSKQISSTGKQANQKHQSILQLVACIGHQHSGALQISTQGIIPHILHSTSLQHIQQLLSYHSSKGRDRSRDRVGGTTDTELGSVNRIFTVYLPKHSYAHTRGASHFAGTRRVYRKKPHDDATVTDVTKNIDQPSVGKKQSKEHEHQVANYCIVTTSSSSKPINHTTVLRINPHASRDADNTASNLFLRSDSSEHLLSLDNLSTLAIDTILVQNHLITVHGYTSGVQLILHSNKKKELIKIPHHLRIADISITSPYIVLLLNNGTVRIYTVSVSGSDKNMKINVFQNRTKFRQSNSKAQHQHQHHVTAMTVYEDIYHYFTRQIEYQHTSYHTSRHYTRDTPAKPMKAAGNDTHNKVDVEMKMGEEKYKDAHDEDADVDELDYLLLSASSEEKWRETQIPMNNTATSSTSVSTTKKVEMYLCLTHMNGALEIYKLPNMDIIWYCEEFHAGYHVVHHAEVSQEGADVIGVSGNGNNDSTASTIPSSMKSNITLPTITQLLVTSFSTYIPHILCTTSNNEIWIYSSFAHTNKRHTDTKQCLSPYHHLSFKRTPHTIPLQRYTSQRKSKHLMPRRLYAMSIPYSASEHPSSPSLTQPQPQCVFLTGKHPYLITTQRSTVRTHAMLFPHTGVADVEDDIDADRDIGDDEDVVMMRDVIRDTSDATNMGEDHSMLDDDEMSMKKRHCSIVSFTSYHTATTPHAYAAVDTLGNLYIFDIPSLLITTQQQYHPPIHNIPLEEYNLSSSHSLLQVNMDSPLYHRYVYLHRTPRFLSHHQDTDTYAVCVMEERETQSMEEITKRSIRVYASVYQLLFITIHDHNVDTSVSTTEPEYTLLGRYDAFDDYEVITCMKSCVLGGTEFSTDDVAGEYLCIGTATQQGEDTLSRGRIIVLDLYYALGITSQSESRRMLKFRSYILREKSPVTAMNTIDGLLLACIGMKMFLYDYRDKKELIGRAFMDTSYYVVSVSVVKNFIVFGDIVKGIYFAVWDNIIRQLLPIGKAIEAMQVSCCHFLIDDKTLNIVTADMYQNYLLHRYTPIRGEHQLSSSINIHTHNGKPPLTLKGNFFTNHITSHMEILKVRTPPQPIPIMELSEHQRQHDLLYIDRLNDIAYVDGILRTLTLSSTLDGHYTILSPIDEYIYRRLHSLYTAMLYSIESCSIGGLNGRSYRLYKGRLQHHIHHQHRRTIVDVNMIIRQYPTLDLYRQYALAKQIGTTREQILDNLAAIQQSTALLP